MSIQQKVASHEKICKWKTGLIGQANGSEVVYLSADPNAGPVKGRFPLVCWILHNVMKLFKGYDWLIMLIILLLTFWYPYNTIQKRRTKVNFYLCKCSLKPIIIEYCYDKLQTRSGNWLLRHVADLESFNRPYMRLWFYAAFIQIEFGSSVRSSYWNYTIKYSFR